MSPLRSPAGTQPAATSEQTSRWLTTDQVAQYLHLRPCTIREYARRGLIPHSRIPGSRIIRYDRLEIDRWMSSSAVAPVRVLHRERHR